MTPTIITSITAMREFIAGEKKLGKKIGFVPTMGALHDGHLSLVKTAKEKSDLVVASIFVNPKQFSASEDIERYPRPLADDIAKLTTMAVPVIYTPSPADIYPADFSTTVAVPSLANILCGAIRPGHFDGVALIVTKLFLQTMPDVAVFGEKDYQQLMIIKKLAQDLNFPITIIGAATVRHNDGLAMSSRNQYLTADERAIAPLLFKTLQATAQKLLAAADARAVFADATNDLLAGGFHKIDYLEWRTADNLSPAHDARQPSRLLVAAHLGRARLIDNIAV
ncbi:MAG: pantoate--beta-alanine ligase [Hydrotalea sp.]|nr:pantoate--beta-alanine ligase [Hydrotalea sp.]